MIKKFWAIAFAMIFALTMSACGQSRTFEYEFGRDTYTVAIDTDDCYELRDEESNTTYYYPYYEVRLWDEEFKDFEVLKSGYASMDNARTILNDTYENRAIERAVYMW